MVDHIRQGDMMFDDGELPGEINNVDRFHIYPLGDTYEHKMSLNYPCCPEEDDGIVIHNSYDGREAYELGFRKHH